ncbi:single-stranded DNA-binding protein [Spiroplasma endosymbiont of Aspidapion aeneum]|uniref:single-stranded DNA-binding protein n=1 Tax=Spiroplasma endosymbiont of Aspidapion aeneum TaxID=3066276 RepID=UPI00313E47D1
MNNVNIIGQVINEPVEVFSSNEDVSLYKILLKLENVEKNKKQKDQYLYVKVWKSLLQKIDALIEGDKIVVNGKIISFGNINNGHVGNDVYVNSIFRI